MTGAKPGKNSETIYGIHPVSAAINAGKRTVESILVAQGKENRKQYEQMLDAAERRGIPVEHVQPRSLDALAETGAHQGIAARVSPYPFEPVEALVARACEKSSPFILVADQVTDPRNLGALARTALCGGASGIIIPKDNSAHPTPAASKASAGALEFLPVSRVTNLARTLDMLKEKGFWITGLERDAPSIIYENDLSGRVVLVVGGEGKGMRRLVRQRCDFVVSIPQWGPVGSLNVSVAGAVAIYEMVRQRYVSQQA